MCGNNTPPSLSLDAFFSRVKHFAREQIIQFFFLWIVNFLKIIDFCFFSILRIRHDFTVEVYRRNQKNDETLKTLYKFFSSFFC